MDWTNKNVAPVQGRVSSATKSKSWSSRSTRTRRRISPRHEAVQGRTRGKSSRTNHKKGDKVKGPIKSITDFGVFVGLAGGIDGLVHLSDLSWNEARRRSGAQLQEGRGSRSGRAGHRRRARAHLAGHQAARRRSVHQLRRRCNDKGTVGDRHGEDGRRQGRRDRSSTTTSRATCALPKSARDRVEDARNVLKEGDEVDGDDHQRRPQDPHHPAVDQGQGQRRRARKRCSSLAQTNAARDAGTTNLGALLRAKLDNAEREQRLTARRGDGRMTKSELIAAAGRSAIRQLVAKDAEFAVKTILDAMARRAGARAAHRDPRLRQLLDQPPPAAHRAAIPSSGEKVHDPRKARAALQAGQGVARGGRRARRRAMRDGRQGRRAAADAPLGADPRR